MAFEMSYLEKKKLCRFRREAVTSKHYINTGLMMTVCVTKTPSLIRQEALEGAVIVISEDYEYFKRYLSIY